MLILFVFSVMWYCLFYNYIILCWFFFVFSVVWYCLFYIILCWFCFCLFSHVVLPILYIIPPYIRMLSSDWLMKGVFLTNSSFFQLFHHCQDICLKISRYYRKNPARDEIPSLNSLLRHGCYSNYSGFFFQPTLK